MKIWNLIIIAAIIQGGCSHETDKADAFGNFEATEVMVSAETSGRIMSYNP
jgi:HlyD family secretion protein